MRFYTFDEVTELFQIHDKKLRTLVANNQIPFIRIGKEYRFLEDDLKQWFTDNRYKTVEITYGKKQAG
ncbi:MAG: helix-turn-helix domain-containing protein [Lachnospiraceae bacterium]|nr:helix-turn-helix domain-containing protein [Lachnospiraceae bacterium]